MRRCTRIGRWNTPVGIRAHLIRSLRRWLRPPPLSHLQYARLDPARVEMRAAHALREDAAMDLWSPHRPALGGGPSLAGTPSRNRREGGNRLHRRLPRPRLANGASRSESIDKRPLPTLRAPSLPLSATLKGPSETVHTERQVALARGITGSSASGPIRGGGVSHRLFTSRGSVPRESLEHQRKQQDSSLLQPLTCPGAAD